MTDPVRRKIRAPENDGEALIDPPLSEAANLVVHNRVVAAEFDRLTGFPADYRFYARLSTSLSLEKSTTDWLSSGGAPFIMTGHQPELFHSGVWFKNYLASRIAESVGGSAINVVIDSDSVRATSILVPTGTPDAPRVVAVPFDAAGEEMPWEVREVLDLDLFRTFASTVSSLFASQASSRAYAGGMILDRLWPMAVASKDRWIVEVQDTIRKRNPSAEFSDIPNEVLQARQKLGWSLSYARHQFEHEIGLSIEDVPLMLLCCSAEFMHFSDIIFGRHQEFFQVYNAALAEHRVLNRIRNNSHPMPDLARVDQWYEAPFWLWTRQNPRRRRTFVRKAGNSWELTDREGITFRPPSGSERNAHELLTAFSRTGAQLRPRALITTMYARLVLSDLFIHGIGGAKYDEVTDGIIRRFFGIEPPKYITATATFRLPIERPQVAVEDVRETQQKLRDVRYRPETFLREPLVRGDAPMQGQLQALADEKRDYLVRHDLRRCQPEVFERLGAINRAMHELLKPVERALSAKLAQMTHDLRRAQLLGSRDFSFVLFPADDLPARLLALTKVSA